MTFEVIARTARLGSGLLLMLFVAMHLANTGLGIFGFDAILAGHPVLTGPWQNVVGETLLCAAILVHAAAGLLAIAQRRTLALGTQDMVQLVLGLAVVPLAAAHVLASRASLAIDPSIEGGYALTLARYWIVSPAASVKQLGMVVVVWIHASIGLVAWLTLRGTWNRLRFAVLPVLFAVPILALLGFVEAGKDVLARYAEDPSFKAGIDANVARTFGLLPILGRLQDVVLGLYGAAVAAALVTLLVRVRAGRSRPVHVTYEDGSVGTGRFGVTILDVSRTSDIPHASICSGRGRCGTCRVRVIRGRELLSPVDEIERRVLRGGEEGGAVRLACRARILGDGLEVERLIPVHADASAAHAPELWLGRARAEEPA